MHPEKFTEDTEHFDTIETEQLKYEPAKLFATIYRRYKYNYSKPGGSTEFFMVKLPEERDKSMAVPFYMAYVTTEKYMCPMPIYWQMQKFFQYGINLSENTIGNWINGTCQSLTAIYDSLRISIVHSVSKYMMVDNTYARRKFHDAKFGDCNRAEHALMLYNKLFNVI